MKQQLFICPRCQAPLDRLAPDRLTCPQDKLDFKNENGIWRFLLPEGTVHFRHFIPDYENIRRLEGRGSPDPEYYRALPFKDLSGQFSDEWGIRAASLRVLTRKVIDRLQDRFERPLKILDLGAGNCWLSNRLAADGHRVMAVDLLVNEQDGLGAWKHYEHEFIPLQADFDHLPLIDHYADVAIFNASLHYSENYTRTLTEALRVLSPEGLITIIDSPVYRRAASGEKMVAERQADFLARFGTASDALHSENFLTYPRLRELGKALGVRWRYLHPFYGLRWWLRPLTAWIQRQREPAKFPVIVGNKI